MRFLTTLLLLPLLTVSGLTHHHDEQHVLDAASESESHTQSQSRVDVDMNVASEALTYQELEQQHTAQINQELQELSTLEDQLQSEQDTQEQQRLWPFSKTVLLRDDHLFLNRLNLKVDNLLMKEPTLIKATQNPPSSLSHVALHIEPYSISELKKIDIVHDEWIRKLGDWFVWKGGYEFNWARMWEPVTKQYRSYVPSVKSQRCGTCWDFATSAMISSNLAVRYGIDRPIQWDPETVNPISLSEGELFECTGRSGIDDVCNGNWIQNAAARVIATGIAQNADYTFTGSLTTNANRCRGNGCGPGCPVVPPATNAAPVVGCNFWPQTCPALSDGRRSANPRFTINNLVSVYNTKDGSPWTGSFTNPLQVQQIRNLLRTKGPLGFYFRVEGGFGLNGNDVWPNNGAIYTTACTRPEINHAMVIVGYGRTSATDPQPNMDYWIVLNSWGNWSTDGFIKIRAGVNLCSAENIVFYPEFPKAYNDNMDPCASQPTQLQRAQCFASLCDNTILSTSRYCKSRGRSNFCKRVRDNNWCPNNNECCKCDQVTSPATTTLNSKDIKLNPSKLGSLSCAAKCAILRGGCSPVCRLYESKCRINIIIDTIKWRDFLLPLDTKLAEAKIRTVDQFAIAKLDGIKPIRTTLADAMKFKTINQNEILVADKTIIDPNIKQKTIIDNIKLANINKVAQPV